MRLTWLTDVIDLQCVANKDADMNEHKLTYQKKEDSFRLLVLTKKTLGLWPNTLETQKKMYMYRRADTNMQTASLNQYNL